MIKLLKYLKKYWLFALLTPLTMVLEVWVDLKQPDLLSRIVDEGVAKGDMDVITKTGLLMIALVALGGLAGISSAFFGSTASQSFGRDLRNAAFRKVMSLSIEQTDSFTTGSLVTRLTNDVTAVQNMVNMGLRFFVRAPLTFIGGIIMALSISWKFGVVIAIALPIEGIIMYLVMRKATPLFSMVQKKLDSVNSVVEENVNGTRVVKAYVREEHEKSRFDIANTELSDVNYRVLMILAHVVPVMMIIMNATIIAVIAVGGYDVGTVGTLKVGQIMSGVTFVTMILSSLIMVGFMFQQITRAMASAKRINEVLDSVPVITDGAGQRLRGIQKRQLPLSRNGRSARAFACRSACRTRRIHSHTRRHRIGQIHACGSYHALLRRDRRRNTRRRRGRKGIQARNAAQKDRFRASEERAFRRYDSRKYPLGRSRRH